MAIQMGNDEFILYIRKIFPLNSIENDELGKSIWHWLRDNDNSAFIVEEDHPCYWGNDGIFVDRTRLPKTAAQFSFDAQVLPQLYIFLNELGNG